jgi:hypothetical protein
MVTTGPHGLQQQHQKASNASRQFSSVLSFGGGCRLLKKVNKRHMKFLKEKRKKIDIYQRS